MQPIRFHSIYFTRIWGGRTMQQILNRTLPDETSSFGEAWELSDRPEAQSTVAEGTFEGLTLHDLWQRHRHHLFGLGYESYDRFPLLCKILDATDNLSVQVHPPIGTARQLDGEEKNEIWYIIRSTPEARIYSGIRPGTTTEDLRQAATDGTMEALIGSAHMNTGEHLYIPSGLIHAIGAGNLIAEIQQNSDTTYRLYDWNRRDAQGHPRELHLEQSITAIKEFQTIIATDQNYLTAMPHFLTEEYHLHAGDPFLAPDPTHFAVLTVLQGSITWGDGQRAQTGEFLLLPVACDAITALEQDTILINTTVPPHSRS